MSNSDLHYGFPFRVKKHNTQREDHVYLKNEDNEYVSPRQDYDIDCTTQLKNLEDLNNRNKKENEDLKQQINNLKMENEDLINVKNENSVLKKENEDLIHDFFFMKEENEFMKNENSVLKNENEFVKNENSVLKNENDGLKNENGILKNENDGLKLELKLLEEDFEKVLDQVLKDNQNSKSTLKNKKKNISPIDDFNSKKERNSMPDYYDTYKKSNLSLKSLKTNLSFF
jgi:hypothetical protein